MKLNNYLIYTCILFSFFIINYFSKNTEGMTTDILSDFNENIKTYSQLKDSYNKNNTVNVMDYSNPSNSQKGITLSQIPKGEEDLYILKSQIIPPVCPKCPDLINNCSGGGKDKCPPCPSCPRCPEPSVECKKVVKYTNYPQKNLPQINLNNFPTNY